MKSSKKSIGERITALLENVVAACQERQMKIQRQT
jgi:hypothetical protein